MQVTYDSAFVIERFFNISTLPLQKLSNSFLMRRTGFFFRKMFIQVLPRESVILQISAHTRHCTIFMY